MTQPWPDRFRDLVEGATPAVLTTYRRDGTAAASPVWYRVHDDAVEVVIAEGDVKLRHLARDPRCSLLVFEAVAPFRGLRIDGEPTLVRGDVTAVRTAIAQRYLGPDRGRRFAAERAPAGVVLTMPAAGARTWDLSGILPA